MDLPSRLVPPAAWLLTGGWGSGYFRSSWVSPGFATKMIFCWFLFLTVPGVLFSFPRGLCFGLHPHRYPLFIFSGGLRRLTGSSSGLSPVVPSSYWREAPGSPGIVPQGCVCLFFSPAGWCRLRFHRNPLGVGARSSGCGLCWWRWRRLAQSGCGGQQGPVASCWCVWCARVVRLGDGVGIDGSWILSMSWWLVDWIPGGGLS